MKKRIFLIIAIYNFAKVSIQFLPNFVRLQRIEIFDLSVYFFLKYKVFFQTNPLVIHVNPGIVASDIADKFLEPLKIWLKPAQPTIQNAKRFSTLLIKGMEHCVTLQTLTDN